jgi:hypothetical protein
VIIFDPRAAKALAVGNHLTIESAAGRRLMATASTRSWVQRYKSPVAISLIDAMRGRPVIAKRVRQ